jgi:hypothetical protein
MGSVGVEHFMQTLGLEAVEIGRTELSHNLAGLGNVPSRSLRSLDHPVGIMFFCCITPARPNYPRFTIVGVFENPIIRGVGKLFGVSLAQFVSHFAHFHLQ